MSAGGPIVDPKLGGFIIIPICPYKLGARPFIVSDNSEITVKLLKKGKSAVFVMDGQLNEEAKYEEKENGALLHPRIGRLNASLKRRGGKKFCKAK